MKLNNVNYLSLPQQVEKNRKNIQSVADKVMDLDAHNVRFNGSGTNYLVSKTDVESAVKELDTQVKGANDELDLKANVAQEAWITPTLVNGWVDSGGGYTGLRYMKDSMGFVHIEGSIKNGTLVIIFTLPNGYRRSLSNRYNAILSIIKNTSIIVQSNGVVAIAQTPNPEEIININISFKAEQ